MGSALFGSAPKATFSTQPTIQPAQESILNTLSSILSNAFPYEQHGFSLGTKSLAALEQQAMGVPTAQTPQQTGAVNQSFDALSRSLGYQAPKIDATEAFQRGVVQPMTTDFLERALPSIAGAAGRGAGGAYSSGPRDARLQAATDFERNLGQIGSQYSLAAETANQNANINAQKNVLAALGLAPSVATLPEQILGSNIGLSSATFNPYQTMIADLIAGGTAGTQNTVGASVGGSTGLLGGLFGGLGSFAGSTGGSALIASLFGGSDRALKENIETVGSVDGFPLYRFTYKALPQAGRQLGFMAQDVEKRLPQAVSNFAGYKRVDYGAVIADVLKEAV